MPNNRKLKIRIGGILNSKDRKAVRIILERKFDPTPSGCFCIDLWDIPKQFHVKSVNFYAALREVDVYITKDVIFDKGE